MPGRCKKRNSSEEGQNLRANKYKDALNIEMALTFSTGAWQAAIHYRTPIYNTL